MTETGPVSCPASFLFPVRLHSGDSVWVLIVPCVRFITRHSGFFFKRRHYVFSFILSHSLAKRRRPPLQCEGRRCWGTTPTVLSSRKKHVSFCQEDQRLVTMTTVTRLLLRYCETDDITTLLFFTNSYSRTTWLMDLSDSRKLSSLQKHCFCFLTICRRKFAEYF